MLEGAKYIKEIRFSELSNWDVKFHFGHAEDLISKSYPLKAFGTFTRSANIEKVAIKDNCEYKILGVRSYGLGAYENRTTLGANLKMKVYQKAKENHLFWCKVDTKNGAFGIITQDLSDGLGSSNMIFAELDLSIVDVCYIQLLFRSPILNSYMDSMVTGSTNRKYIKFSELLSNVKIPLPTLKEQNKLVAEYNRAMDLAAAQEAEASAKENEIEKYLFGKLGITITEQSKVKGMQLVAFKNLSEWGLEKIANSSNSLSSYEIVNLNKYPSAMLALFRGKSPKYKAESESTMLNQKCIRWNELDLQWVKNVDENWIKTIEPKFFTTTNDILINSTGEGTIGRAAVVAKGYDGLLYDSHVLLLRLNMKIVNPQYYVELFNSSYGQRQVNNIKSAQSTKQTELGTSNLKKIEFPIPKLEIQDEIVAHISGLKQEIKTLHTSAANNRQKALSNFEQKIF